MISRNVATAFAPAGVGNVAVGFDLIGQAIAGVGDRVTVRVTEQPGVRILDISGTVTDLPKVAEANTAGAAAIHFSTELGLDVGLELSLHKGIPLGSGMGGSAASAVAAVVAINGLLERPLPRHALYESAMAGEFVASQAEHGDNVVACLMGGIALVGPDGPISIPSPHGVYCTLVHPDLVIRTEDARACLPATIPLEQVITQQGHLARFIVGCERGDLELIRTSLIDDLIEPLRAHLIPGFSAVKKAAMDGGALGCSISGAGPSVFAWFVGEKAARTAGERMQDAFADAGLRSQVYVSELDAPGARVEPS